MKTKSKATRRTVKSKKNTRAKYGFELNFPKRFTLAELSKKKHGKIKYITLYMRVQKALEDGEIKPVGEKTPKKATRGRRQIIFERVDAKTSVVSVSKTNTAPAIETPVVTVAPVAPTPTEHSIATVTPDATTPAVEAAAPAPAVVPSAIAA